MNFKCRSTMNQKTIEEAITPMFYRQRYMALAAQAIFVVICLFVLKDGLLSSDNPTRTANLLILLGGVIIIGFFTKFSNRRSIRKYAANMVSQMKTSLHRESMVKTVDFTETVCRSDNPDGSKKTFFMTDLDFWYETKDFVVLVFKGMLFIMCDKDGIEIGETEFKSYLSGFAKKKFK